MKKCYCVIIGIVAAIVTIAAYLYFGQMTTKSSDRKWEPVCTRAGMKELIDSCKALNDSIQ